MNVFRAIIYVLDFIQNPIKFFFSISYQFPLIFGCILILGCLIRLICKLAHNSYHSNVDMTGKTVLITGASDGVGKATAFDLAKRNARILLACRNVEKGHEVAEQIKSATGNRNVVVECLDLSSFESVRQCATRILDRERKLHVLINTDSISDDPRRRTDDGCEVVMQTNCFGHFLLTLLLLDLLKCSTPSRIINDVFDQPWYKKFDVEDLNNERGLHQFDVYFRSKIALLLFTRELACRLQRTGITVNSAYPGLIKSDHTQKSINGKISYLLAGKTFEEVSLTIIMLAVDPDLERTTGKKFHNCEEYPIYIKEAKDITIAKRLFELSERTVGVSF